MPLLEASYDRHHLTFRRYVKNPKHSIATCSCGWMTSGPTREVYDRAASHDQFQFAPIPKGVTMVNLDDPANLHNALKKVLGE